MKKNANQQLDAIQQQRFPNSSFQQWVKGGKEDITPLRLKSKSQGSLEELALLEGTWVGNQGWNLISVPIKGSPNPSDFKVLIAPYMEVLTFSPVAGAVPNRGHVGTQKNFAIEYTMQINDLINKSGMHAETGMFINQSNELAPGEPRITRQSIVPHGNSLLAFGDAETERGEHLSFQDRAEKLNEAFSPRPKVNKGKFVGYEEGFEGVVAKVMKEFEGQTTFDPLKPADFLLESIKDQNITTMVTLDLKCDNNSKDLGGILNTPFITKNADTPAMHSIFWIEEVDLGNDESFMQLQYLQVVDIVFPTGGDTIITWPHVSLNTLVRIR